MKKTALILVLFIFLFAVLATASDDPNEMTLSLKQKIEYLEARIVRLRKLVLEQKKLVKEKEQTIQTLMKENDEFRKLLKTAGLLMDDKLEITPPTGPRYGTETRKPLGFTELEMASYGWIHTVTVQKVIHERKAIVSFVLHDETGYVLKSYGDFVTRRAILNGVLTKNAVYKSGIKLNCLCQIVGKEKYRDTYYFVIQPVLLREKNIHTEE